MISSLKTSKPHQWYSKLKRMTSYNQQEDVINVDEISHYSDNFQADIIAEKFASISNEYDELNESDIQMPKVDPASVPFFTPAGVLPYLENLKTNKSSIPGDIPAKFIKLLASYISIPFSHIMNTMFKNGEFPLLWKHEIQTPIPKTYPPTQISDLRNISGLMNLEKVAEKILAEMIISDTKANIDISQYGNQPGTSIQHYLLNMLFKILQTLDSNSYKEKFAVIATFIDWKEAFPRQCPKLGVEAFVRLGVRPSIIPILVNFFQDRSMQVKWHNVLSKIHKLKGGGIQGSHLGLLEYIMQSNNNTDGIPVDEKFKFIDDLTTLEIVNLLAVGITSLNIKVQVPNDIPTDNGYIPPESLITQKRVDAICEWTQKNKMKLNHKKSNIMIFNNTKHFKFSTRIAMNGEILPVVKKTKILGTILTDDLKWNVNTSELVKKGNQRLQLLRKTRELTDNIQDLKIIYFLFIRSILEQSAVIWHSSLSEENISDLERVQKNALRIILGKSYMSESYERSLELAGIESLYQRRCHLIQKFASNCATNVRTKKHFEVNKKSHDMKTRKTEKYKVHYARTVKLKKSAVIHMQNILNKKQDI